MLIHIQCSCLTRANPTNQSSLHMIIKQNWVVLRKQHWKNIINPWQISPFSNHFFVKMENETPKDQNKIKRNSCCKCCGSAIMTLCYLYYSVFICLQESSVQRLTQQRNYSSDIGGLFKYYVVPVTCALELSCDSLLFVITNNWIVTQWKVFSYKNNFRINIVNT